MVSMTELDDWMYRHIVSVSGGKDSTALLILAKLERGVDVLPVFADTMHEHPETYRYLEYLDRVLGPIQTVRADFQRQIARKRKFIAEHWADDGVPQERIDRALELLRPTGNAFLDLCMWKGRFPSTRRRFCSEELKHIPIREKIVEPLLADGFTVISWQGVRAEESLSRANLDIVEEPEEGLIVYRPIITYTVDDVFTLHRKHGIQWNPLYEQGMGRVGCMPCIHATKGEMREIAERFPEELARVAEWERLVSQVSKRGSSTFYNVRVIEKDDTANVHYSTHGIDKIAQWANTGRPGKHIPISVEKPDGAMCSSIYGLCESAV